MFDSLACYKPRLYYLKFNWKLLDNGWSDCNTDGACRGNPGESAYGFYFRSVEGNIIYDESGYMRIATNMEPESMAIWKALC